MRKALVLTIGLMLILTNFADASPQRGRKAKGAKQRQKEKQARRAQPQDPIGDSNPLAIGDSGVAWYTTWETGLAEAKRSNRPIFFMSAATTCSGVPGIF